MNPNIPTVGVEEEYQLVDASSGVLLPNCKAVMQTLRQSQDATECDSDIQHELHLNQIEMASEICHSLNDVHETLSKTRQVLAEAARRNHCELAAAGTNPLPIPQQDSTTPKDRYLSMLSRYQQIARDLYIFGCHVHVAMDNRELGLRVMNRCRQWLPLLTALTANSPFWDGKDTGYASYRRELWAQWPLAGPPPHFESLKEFESCVAELIAVNAIQDESFIYWDIRLPTKIPTIEFRGADVLTSVEDAVGYVGIIRAVVMHAIAQIRNGESYTPIRPNLLAFAIWNSARYGTSDHLVDPVANESISAANAIDRLIDTIGGILNQTGERDPVEHFLNRVITEGTGAEQQRKSASLKQAVLDVVTRTTSQHIGATIEEATTQAAI